MRSRDCAWALGKVVTKVLGTDIGGDPLIVLALVVHQGGEQVHATDGHLVR
jgi:hypothetical protein